MPPATEPVERPGKGNRPAGPFDPKEWEQWVYLGIQADRSNPREYDAWADDRPANIDARYHRGRTV